MITSIALTVHNKAAISMMLGAVIALLFIIALVWVLFGLQGCALRPESLMPTH